jgi:hypothetical protein
MEYEYKVVNFTAEATTADVRKGVHNDKVRAQLELELQRYARDGWELQGQYNFDMTIKAGCFDGLLKLFGQGTSDGDYRIQQLVFRKQK